MRLAEELAQLQGCIPVSQVVHALLRTLFFTDCSSVSEDPPRQSHGKRDKPDSIVSCDIFRFDAGTCLVQLLVGNRVQSKRQWYSVSLAGGDIGKEQLHFRGVSCCPVSELLHSAGYLHQTYSDSVLPSTFPTERTGWAVERIIHHDSSLHFRQDLPVHREQSYWMEAEPKSGPFPPTLLSRLPTHSKARSRCRQRWWTAPQG